MIILNKSKRAKRQQILKTKILLSKIIAESFFFRYNKGMVKYILALLILSGSIITETSFADDASGSYDDIMPNWEIGQTTSNSTTPKNNTKTSTSSTKSRKTLKLPDIKNYDHAIKNNRIIKTIGDGQGRGGIKYAFRNLVGPDSAIIPVINYIMAAIALIWLSILGAKFIFSRGEEENLSKYKQQFGWIILGLLIISIAEYVAFNVFDPVSTGALDTNDGVNQFVEIIRKIITFLKYLVGGVALLAGVRSGFALIVGGGEDDVIQKEKEFVKIFLFAIALIIMAESLERWIDLSAGGVGIQAEGLVIEAVGIINFILTFIAGAALFMLVLSSLYYIISFGDEEITGRAKKMIIASIVGLIIAYSAYTIVRFLV